MVYPKIKETIAQFARRSITAERKSLLQPLIDYINIKLDKNEVITLNFICTHNSRRSHLSQIWAKALSHHYGFSSIRCFSAGTEATAVYPTVIRVLKESGFTINITKKGKNPHYQILFSDEDQGIEAYSKTISEIKITTQFAAVMTCSQAAESCPFVPGAETRIILPYEDPKVADGTKNEFFHYQQRSNQIANEMMYVFESAKNN